MKRLLLFVLFVSSCLLFSVAALVPAEAGFRGRGHGGFHHHHGFDYGYRGFHGGYGGYGYGGGYNGPIVVQQPPVVLPPIVAEPPAAAQPLSTAAQPPPDNGLQAAIEQLLKAGKTVEITLDKDGRPVVRGK